jgi:hypothetical protein
LENSGDLVSHEARNAEELYGKYPSRLARIQGLVAFEVAHEKAITALREALAEQPAQQEPVATLFGSLPVYDTSPPAQRTWVGLSDLDMDVLENEYMKSAQTAHEFLRAIEAKLKEKNT